ncbi:uncharacterized protein LOC110251147 [Exaiptasia diaphana]|uniref:Uncharacterized protein n=1 Tax=Exaiptasia diaphana TaxID=2652724 RepID=A0A913YX23_EXADI|nr:uncharacterized protein LOC110251147 [Exaiptasia diaphana]
MAGHVAAKLDDITSKLDRLKSIEETIHNVAGSIKALEQKIEKVEQNVKEVKQEQQVMDKSLETMNNEIQQLKNDRKRDDFEYYGIQEETKSELNTLKTKLLYAEAYSRRENLKFIGIPELDDEDTKKVLLNFIDNHLEIESSPIEFQ